MDSIKSSLRKLIEAHPDSLHKITKDARVPYFPVYRFMKGQTATLDTDIAEAIAKELGKPITMGKEVAA